MHDLRVYFRDIDVIQTIGGVLTPERDERALDVLDEGDGDARLIFREQYVFRIHIIVLELHQDIGAENVVTDFAEQLDVHAKPGAGERKVRRATPAMRLEVLSDHLLSQRR